MSEVVVFEWESGGAGERESGRVGVREYGSVGDDEKVRHGQGDTRRIAEVSLKD